MALMLYLWGRRILHLIWDLPDNLRILKWLKFTNGGPLLVKNIIKLPVWHSLVPAFRIFRRWFIVSLLTVRITDFCVMVTKIYTANWKIWVSNSNISPIFDLQFVKISEDRCKAGTGFAAVLFMLQIIPQSIRSN